MPIIDLQARLYQIGEIRIGHVIDTGKVSQKTGKPITRPDKLNAFRFTSPSRPILERVATLYGGEVTPWTPANGGPSAWQVYSTSDRLPVTIPPRDAVSQWYELYRGSKCERRCDGVTEHKKDKPCLCNPDNRQCTITTRVNVMLTKVKGVGQWLLVTKGYHAAVELPALAELLSRAGDYVAASLFMVEKSLVTDDGPVRFMIPRLEVELSPEELLAGRITGAPEIVAGPERTAIEAPRPDYAALASIAKTADEVLKLFRQAEKAGHLTPDLDARLKARGKSLRAAEAAVPTGDPDYDPDYDVDAMAANEEQYRAQTAAAGPVPEVVEAEFVDEEDDPTVVWFQVMAIAGARGWDTAYVDDRFAAANDGLLPSSATTAQLTAFLTSLKGSK